MRILFKLRAWPQGPNVLAVALYVRPGTTRWALYCWPLAGKCRVIELPVVARVYA